MPEFDSVSVSSFEASTLAAKLTEKAADGWDVVAIVPTGSDITAFLKREAEASAATTGASGWEAGSTTGQAATAAAAGAASTPTEPSGWGSAPAGSSTSGWGSSSSDQSGSSWGASSTPAAGSTAWGGSNQAGATPTAPASAPSTPSVPAGWYSDPAGRFELRYWDGSAWTEHVSRAGQQYTDPPVA